MYRIRFHGRGGQGVKTAARILGSAFFAEGYEVQDAPRYGAERRGAPIDASVRAAREPIRERGPIRRPDLVVVADETLLGVAAASVLEGVTACTGLLLASSEPAEIWRARLSLEGPIWTLPLEVEARAELRFVGATLAAGAAALTGAIGRESLLGALEEELGGLAPALRAENRARALAAFERLGAHAGSVHPAREPAAHAAPDWIELGFEPAERSAPDVRVPGTSVEVRTGLWRTFRPEIDLDTCRRCTWVCTTLCPDGAILVSDAGAPEIDYDHCKGCLVCVAVCPAHAIGAAPERGAGAPT